MDEQAKATGGGTLTVLRALCTVVIMPAALFLGAALVFVALPALVLLLAAMLLTDGQILLVLFPSLQEDDKSIGVGFAVVMCLTMIGIIAGGMWTVRRRRAAAATPPTPET